MKTSRTISFFLISISLFLTIILKAESQEYSTEDRAQRDESISLWRSKLDDSRHLKAAEKFEFLGRGLRRLGVLRNTAYRTSDLQQLFRDIQDEMINTPGHAKYFADEIERIRKSEESLPSGQRVDYHRWRKWYLHETLKNLPSPETVEVLGRYLDDERDTPPHTNFPLENAYYASLSLGEIGLRDKPELPIPSLGTWRKTRDIWKAWYESVKAGERSFSFVGQNKQYRFQADGSVAISAYDGPPDPPKALKTPIGAVSPNSSKTLSANCWAWIGGAAGVVVLLLAGWYYKRRAA